jgi:hypothetical protein
MDEKTDPLIKAGHMGIYVSCKEEGREGERKTVREGKIKFKKKKRKRVRKAAHRIRLYSSAAAYLTKS